MDILLVLVSAPRAIFSIDTPALPRYTIGMNRLQRITLFRTVALVVFLLISFQNSTGRKPARFSFLFIGDILPVNEIITQLNVHSVDFPFQKIREDLFKYDFVFGNLETPVTDRGYIFVSKAYNFRLSPRLALCIKDLKLDVVSVANNHLMDYGVTGMEDTFEFLDRNNILYAGGGSTLAEARRPARLSRGDTVMYVLAYCGRPPQEFYAGKKRPGIAPIDIDVIREDIASCKTPDNIVFVSLHWGIEQTHIPQPYQIRQARQIIDAGADAIIGHHPHWPQGIEVYKGKPIIYSLGNFINGFINPVERDNIGVVFNYAGNRLEHIKVIPIAGRNRKSRFQPYILTGRDAGECLALIRSFSKQLGTDIEITGDYGFIDMMRGDVRIGMRD